VNDVRAPIPLQIFSVVLFTVGCFIHFVSDAHKSAILSVRKGLITDGLWSLSRNINYFGELLIYLSFTVLSLHWLPITYLLTFVVSFWLPRMLKKDQSISRHATFAEYKRKTAFFIPYVL
jgi:steroid 5-alpha reductase family enzyme